TIGSTAQPITNPMPPPCLWEPVGDAVTGSQYIIQNYGAIGPSSYFGVTQSVQLAKKLLKQSPPPAGTWYELPTNPAASASAQQQCQKLPLFFFDRPGQALPAVPVAPLTLAQYAYNHMVIPTPSLRINPRDKGYVNLATYLWAHWPRISRTGPVEYHMFAQLGAEIVTVWAQSTSLQINVTGPGTAYDTSCTIRRGSHYPVESPPANSGPGMPPDCGVLWQGPAAAATINVTVSFNVTWGQGMFTGPGPTTPLAGAHLTASVTLPPLRVEEIQSINGG
ncbi:MAG TPA: hypothetical protein VIV12_11120, partial [Streptosporangiaceae bacterium]